MSTHLNPRQKQAEKKRRKLQAKRESLVRVFRDIHAKKHAENEANSRIVFKGNNPQTSSFPHIPARTDHSRAFDEELVNIRKLALDEMMRKTYHHEHHRLPDPYVAHPVSYRMSFQEDDGYSRMSSWEIHRDVERLKRIKMKEMEDLADRVNESWEERRKGVR